MVCVACYVLCLVCCCCVTSSCVCRCLLIRCWLCVVDWRLLYGVRCAVGCVRFGVLSLFVYVRIVPNRLPSGVVVVCCVLYVDVLCAGLLVLLCALSLVVRC